MGIRFGEIDSGQILDNEFRIGVLERILAWIVDNNCNLAQPTEQSIQEIRKSVLGKLQEKYPKSGISYKGA